MTGMITEPGQEEPETEPEIEPATPLAETVERVEKDRIKREGKYDKRVEEILFDYERMPVSDLERKWGMHRSYFYPFKKRWEARGIAFPTAYADNQTTPPDERAGNQGRRRTGKYFKCVDCGKWIYVRKYRLDEKPEAEHRCAKCAKKHYPPPPKKAEPGLKKALRRWVKEDIDLSQDAVYNLLSTYLVKEPEATTNALVGARAFTVEEFCRKALELYVEVIIEESGRFEKVGEGLYKLTGFIPDEEIAPASTKVKDNIPNNIPILIEPLPDAEGA